ncbi:hypothetical protein [Sulfitobacter albidus]|nr:hypothetical protein [Sulfitobacter albidus]
MGLVNYALAGMLGTVTALAFFIAETDMSTGPLQPELDGGIQVR